VGDDRYAYRCAGARGRLQQPIEAQLLLDRDPCVGAVEQALVKQHVASRVAVGQREGGERHERREREQQREQRSEPHEDTLRLGCNGLARRLSVQANAISSTPRTRAISTLGLKLLPDGPFVDGDVVRSAAVSFAAGIG
jgi:hypothetical protein